MEFGEILYSLRKKHGLSQKQLAQDLGVAQASINYWEKGERTPSIEAAKKVADYFGISVDDLLSGIIEQSKANLKRVFSFRDYLNTLGYEVTESPDNDKWIIHVKEFETDVYLTSKEMAVLENTTRENLDLRISKYMNDGKHNE